MTGLLASLLESGSYSTKEPYFSKTPGFFAVILVHSACLMVSCRPTTKTLFSVCLMSGFILPLSCCARHTCTYYMHRSSGFFYIIMSPAEGLHFSALVNYSSMYAQDISSHHTSELVSIDKIKHSCACEFLFSTIVYVLRLFKHHQL